MKYNPALDGIRAVAVLMVIAYHVKVFEVRSGYLGVDAFFVLSGYLITSILLREHDNGGIRLGAFYLRRARRLYPALCLLVGAMLALGWASPKGAAHTLLYVNDYLGGSGSLAHTWSLAVEEHYYMIWPLLLPFVARLPRRKGAWVLGAAYIVANAWSAMHLNSAAETMRFDTHMTGLILGSLLAFIPVGSLLPLGLLGLSVVALACGVEANRTFVEAATACIILLSNVTVVPWLTRSWLIYIGKISYGLYLFHAPIAFLTRDGIMTWQERFAITFLASFGMAVLSYHTVEAYFRRPRQLSGKAAVGGMKVVPEG